MKQDSARATPAGHWVPQTCPDEAFEQGEGERKTFALVDVTSPPRRASALAPPLPSDPLLLPPQSTRSDSTGPPQSAAEATRATSASLSPTNMATPPPAVEPEFSLRTLEILTLDDEVIPIELDDLADVENTVAVVELLGQEKAPVKFWIRVAEEVWRLKRWSGAMDILNTGLVGT